MKFEEALKMLKEGKKVRRNNWENEYCYISFDHNGSLLQYSICNDDYWGNYYYLHKTDLDADWEEYKEPLLNNEEKEFLKGVMEFVDFKINEISIVRNSVGMFIELYDENGEDDATPYLKTSYFKNLENDKRYSLNELGL